MLSCRKCLKPINWQEVNVHCFEIDSLFQADNRTAIIIYTTEYSRKVPFAQNYNKRSLTRTNVVKYGLQVVIYYECLDGKGVRAASVSIEYVIGESVVLSSVVVLIFSHFAAVK